MQRVLSKDQEIDIVEKLSQACSKVAVGMRAYSKSIMQLYRVMEAFEIAQRAVYKYTHRRVLHLAKHAKKARVRKKNRNRIRRMK